jgi:formylglycine-generating enzyme required for sulfatase activity
VPGGTFYRTYANDGGGPTGEADPATVSGFRLDKYLVTVGRFRQFVEAVLPDGGAEWLGDGGFPDGGLMWVPEAGSGKHAHLNEGNGLANEPNVTSGQTYDPGWSSGDNGNVAPTNANLRAPGIRPGPALLAATRICRSTA